MMTWTLFFMWQMVGPQWMSGHIPFETLELCEAAKPVLLAEYKASAGHRFTRAHLVCLRTGKGEEDRR